MLLQFSVENFISFKEEVLLNMVPAKSRTKKEHIIIDEKGKRTETLPVATIYGANASGKTNFIKALDFAKKFILNGTRPNEPTGTKVHLLDPEMEKKPSRFEFVIKHDGIVYTYGFLASTQTVYEEWLFAYYSSQESCVFERITQDNRTKVKPGQRLVADAKGSKFIDFVAQGTRPNQLFLTEANEKNIELLKPITHWFAEHLHIIWPNSRYSSLTLRAHKDKDFIDFLANYLRLADTGIHNISCESEEFDPDKHLKDAPQEIRQEVVRELEHDNVSQILLAGPNGAFTICQEKKNDKKFINYLKLKMEHKRSDGSIIDFDTINESDGTRRLMDLVPMLQDVWTRDRVFVIDELDRSLHTHLSRLFLLACITSVAEKNARGQFIMTTHDTNLLDRNLLRRDEIWFMEKDPSGSSHLTSLAEYKVSDGLNYENGYLNGRFGAIPFVGNVMELLEEEPE